MSSTQCHHQAEGIEMCINCRGGETGLGAGIGKGNSWDGGGVSRWGSREGTRARCIFICGMGSVGE